MATREERERRRTERLAAERREAANERRRLLIGYAVAGVLGLAVIVGIVIVIANSGGGGGDGPTVDGEDVPAAAHIEPQSGFLHDYTPDGREGTAPPALEQGDLTAAAEEASCELDLDLEDEGNTHIAKRDDAPDYGTNPPTSGDHWPEQLADGAYDEYPDPIYSVHALEHGRVAIQYSPDLSEAEQLELKGLFDEDFDGVLLFPNPDMPWEVAATAWTQMIGCDSYEGRATIDALRDFRDRYRGQGPENVPIVIPDEG
jgi:hypothetical protein